MEKSMIRRAMIEKRRALSETEQIRLSGLAAARVFMLPAYKNAELVFLYAAINGEVDIAPIAEKALADGKQIAYPVCRKDGQMDFYRISSLNELSPQGPYRIPEPPACLETLVTPSSTQSSLMIVPGVAFDRERNRLGYGGGYYDRYLAKHREKIACIAAIAYPFQMVSGLPAGDHDQKPDLIILAE